MNPLDNISSLPDRRLSDVLKAEAFYSDADFPNTAFRYKGEATEPKWEVYTVQKQTTPDDRAFVSDAGIPNIIIAVAKELSILKKGDGCDRWVEPSEWMENVFEATRVIIPIAFFLQKEFGEGDKVVKYLMRALFGDRGDSR